MNRLLCVLLATSLLMACTKDQENQLPEEQTYPVSFDVSTFSQTISEWDVPTKAGVEKMKTIKYTIYAKAGFSVKGGIQSYKDYGFGRIYHELTPGDYKIVVMASGCESTGYNGALYSESWIAVADGKDEDVFMKELDFSVLPYQYIDRSITLDRIVGRLDVILTDAMPSYVSAINVKVDSVNIFYNLVPNITYDNSFFTSYSCEFKLPSSMIGQANNLFPVYVLGQKHKHAEVTITAFNDQNGILATKKVNQVTIVANKKTILRGQLLSDWRDSMMFHVMLDDVWLEDKIEINF